MIVDKLKELKNVTTQEQAVIDYILKEPWKILDISIHDLSLVTYTSAATIVRLTKKLGFKGYSEFKYHFASEYGLMMFEHEKDSDALVSADMKSDELIERLPMLYLKVIEQTKTFMDRLALIRASNHLLSVNHIHVYATGIAYPVGMIFEHKMAELGFKVSVHNAMNWSQIGQIKAKGEKLYSILITLTGNNSSIDEIAKKLHGLDFPFLLISANSELKTKVFATEFFRLYWSQRDELSSTRYVFALQYVLDHLVSMMMIKRHPELLKAFDQVKEVFFEERNRTKK